MSAAANQQPLDNVVRESSTTPVVGLVFQNQKLGSFTVHFTVDGEPVKPNRADGYLAIKPRGHDRATRHFIVTSDEALPSVKEFVKQLNAFYGRSADYKVAQIHYKPQSR
jgi:hypothetical protein